jgi:hypothetical protein
MPQDFARLASGVFLTSLVSFQLLLSLTQPVIFFKLIGDIP